MIKRLSLVFAIITAISGSAQQKGTTSPYSFFGLGSLTFDGTAENRSMGGISTYSDSIHFNFRNPASYTGENLKIVGYNNESRPIKFTVGGSASRDNLKSSTDEFRQGTATFDYIGMSFPVGKFGIGFGLLPFSSVGYELESINEDNLITNRFEGEGGLNKTFLGLAYHVSKNLNVGVDVSYNFGDITNNAFGIFYDDENVLLQTQTRETNISKLSGLSYNFGVTYTPMLTDKLQLHTSFTFAPSSNITSKNERSLATVLLQANADEIEINSLDVNLEALNLDQTQLTLPSKTSIGAGIGQPRKWFVGVDYSLLKTSEYSNRTFEVGNSTFEDGYNLAVGGFFVPKYRSFSYWNRITYRAGAHIENTGLVINNEQINEFGMSFGLGLPLRDLSNVNIGFEIGQRGTTKAGLVQENFLNLKLSLSINDRWFVKRKFR